MRSIPMNPAQAITWESPQQAQAAGAAIGGATGAALGGALWYGAARIHPVGKYVGVLLPVLGGVLGYRSWRGLLEPGAQR